MRTFYLGVLGAGVLVGSFLITLWLTEPTTPPDIKPAPPSIKSDIFAANLVRDERTLPAAANAAGLKPSDKLKGVVDTVTRLDSAQVRIDGWAVDLHGENGPKLRKHHGPPGIEHVNVVSSIKRAGLAGSANSCRAPRRYLICLECSSCAIAVRGRALDRRG
jgi:hypothetical protein